MQPSKNLTIKSSEELLKKIRSLREQKGKEKETLNLINMALLSGRDFVIDLFWEEALIYQHLAMKEMSKQTPNLRKKKEALEKMEATILEAEFYIEKFKIDRWKSRLHRFKGRIYDYKNEFDKSIEEYKKGIIYAKKDPDDIEKKYPRWLELEAFLASATLMSGKTKEGLRLSKEVYKKFDQTKEGKYLKKEDYPVWVIWKTGIPIRVGFWYLKNKKGIEKRELLDWLEEGEKTINKPVVSPKWKGKMDFQFRKNEITAIRRGLKA